MDDAAHGLRVNLDQLVYQDGVLTPPDTPHCFAYYITILNEGQETVTAVTVSCPSFRIVM